MFLASSLSPPSLLIAVARGPSFSQSSVDGASENSTFGVQTLMAMRKFLDEAEPRSHQEMCSAAKRQRKLRIKETPSATRRIQWAKKKFQRRIQWARKELMQKMGILQTEAKKEVIRAFRSFTPQL